MIKKIALAVVVIILGVLGFAATRPDSFSVERSVVIKAPPEKVLSYISDFHGWAAWSPWEHIDADLKRTYSGSANGKGAVYQWQGEKTGEGRMEITDVSASKVTVALEFIKPFPAKNVTEFSVDVKGDTTTLRWLMTGQNNFMSKVMLVFTSMDKMIGPDFDQGLANLKREAEKA